MSINFNNKRIPKIYQGSNLVHEEASNGDDGSIPQKAILIGNTNIARIMQGNELVWGETYFPPVESPYARPNELLLWYDFTRNTNESSDKETIRDLSGNGNNGVLHNFSFSEESGYVGNGLRFDGIDDYLTFNDMIFNPEDDFTIEIRMEKIVGEPDVRMNQQASLDYQFTMHESYLSMWDSNNPTNIGVRPRHSQENHYVLKREDTMTIALNNGEYSTLASEQVPQDWSNIRIYNSFGISEYVFEGVISSIRIYKSALNDIDIKHNYYIDNYIDNGLNSVVTEETVNTAIPFGIEFIFDETKEIGFEEITQEGTDGKSDITYSVVHIDGEEIGKAEKFRDAISEATNEIKVIGVKGSVVYGEGSTSIESFDYMEAGLTGDIIIADSVTYIADYTFYGNQINSVFIPNSVLTIEAGIFDTNQLTSVYLPNSVTFIGMYAFNNNKLTSIYIPNSVTYIEMYAFSENQLTSVVIPDSVTHIEEYAFGSNPLTEVSIGSNTTYDSTAFPDSAVINVR